MWRAETNDPRVALDSRGVADGLGSTLFSGGSSLKVTVPPRWQSLSRYLDVAAITAVLLVATFFRLDGLARTPPGLFQDEAVDIANAWPILHGHFQIYYGEREPLYMYLVAASMLVFGPIPLALRVTSVLTSLLTVAAGGALVRSLYGRWIGLVAAFGVATSIWLNAIGRFGERAVTLPLVECLGLALFWRASRSGRYRDFALAGAVLGLTLYTYLASRFFPISLVLFVILSAIFSRSWFHARFGGFLVSGVAAVVVDLPLGYYILRNPIAMFGRADQVALPSGGAFWPALLANSLRTIGLTIVRGDSNWRQNFGNAPVFDALTFVLFLIGLGVAFKRRRPADLLLLTLLPTMLAPSALSDASPHFLRASGAAIALYALAALGLAAVVGLITVARKRTEQTGGPSVQSDRSRRAPRIVIAASVTALALAVPLVRGATLFLIEYPNRPELLDYYNVAAADAGRYLAQSPVWRASPRNVYITDRFSDIRPSIGGFLFPILSPAEQDHWLEDSVIGIFYNQQEVIPLPTGPSVYVAQGSTTRLRAVLPDLQSVNIDSRARDLAIFTVDGAPPPVGAPADVRFGTWLHLDRVQMTGNAIGLYWTVLAAPPYSPSAFVHLLDAGGHQVGGSDVQITLDPVFWKTGRRFVTWHELEIAPGTPPGDYSVTVGVYRKSTGERAPADTANRVTSEAIVGSFPLDHLVVGQPQATKTVQAVVQSGLTLEGYDPPAATVAPGGHLTVTLDWRATVSPPRPDYHALLELVDGAGGIVGRSDVLIGGPKFPTSRWTADQVIQQFVDVAVAPTAQGPLRLVLFVPSPTGAQGNGTPLAAVQAAGVAHVFAMPRVPHPLSARFGSVGTLLGDDLQPAPVKAGGALRVVLYWKAVGASSVPLTVFVHVLNAHGQIIAQRDSPPVGGQRPTTGWLADEVIVDRYQIPIPASAPAGPATIEVGLYDPATGKRVQVLAPNGTSADHLSLGPVTISAP